MKTFLIALMAICSVNAFAAGSDDGVDTFSSWSEINSSNKVEANFPGIKMDNGPAVPVNRLCRDGNQIRTVKKIRGCAIVSRGEVSCAKESFYGRAEMSGYKQKCEPVGAGHIECVDDVPYELSTVHEVPVYTAKKSGRDDAVLKFTKPYMIPDCQ